MDNDSNDKAIHKDCSDVNSLDSKNTVFLTPILHACKSDKIAKKAGVGGIETLTKQRMGYFTILNIETETSHRHQDWYEFSLKELMDNACDWLNDHYRARKPEDKEIRKIGVRIWLTSNGNDNQFVHIAVRNSNVNNKPVFQNLDKKFDYDNWSSTKRNQHRMTSGSLGDALKRIPGMAYALWTDGFNHEETFEEKQWNEPVIIRCNGKEFRVFIRDPNTEAEILENSPTRDIGPDTEVEVTLPIIDIDVENLLLYMKAYFLSFKISKVRTYCEFYCPQLGEDN